MTDREKIISAIEKAKKQSKEYAQDRIIVPFKEADIIIDLLKEQEPIAPYQFEDIWKCGKCGNGVVCYQELAPGGIKETRFDYCPMCGRKVKWNEI